MAAAVMSLPESPHLQPSPLMANSVSTTASYLPQKLYKVKNVDDKGRIIHIGYIEITDTELVFQYEHYPSAEGIKWPLTCIRKYGTNNKGTLFIIEAGRRAPQGEGMYAFRTKEAEELRRKIEHRVRKV